MFKADCPFNRSPAVCGSDTCQFADFKVTRNQNGDSGNNNVAMITFISSPDTR